jgi:hypothetical protein
MAAPAIARAVCEVSGLILGALSRSEISCTPAAYDANTEGENEDKRESKKGRNKTNETSSGNTDEKSYRRKLPRPRGIRATSRSVRLSASALASYPRVYLSLAQPPRHPRERQTAAAAPPPYVLLPTRSHLLSSHREQHRVIRRGSGTSVVHNAGELVDLSRES